MKTIVCTMVIGSHRIEECNNFVKTFLEHTDYDIVIYTDQQDLKYDGIRVIDIKQVTPLDTYKGATFNFNLKGIVTAYTYNTLMEYDRVIWADCDVNLVNRCETLENMTEYDVYCKHSDVPRGTPEAPLQGESKFKLLAPLLGMEQEEIKNLHYYCNEVLLVFNRNSRTRSALNHWSTICTVSFTSGLNPCFEAVEFAIALYKVKDLTVYKIPRNPIDNVVTLYTTHREKEFPWM